MIELNIFIGFLTCFILLIILRPLALRLNLVDFPTERKDHSGNVPLIGGICIFFGILITSFFVEFNKFSIVLLFTSSLILTQGVWDDFINLRPKSKMAFQIFLTAIIIYITDVKLESFGYLFGDSFPVELGVFSVPITIIAVVGLTNAINMIDGLDGFATSFVIIAIIGLLSFNVNLEFSSFNNLLLTIVVSLVPFMIFNIAPYPKMKVFLGDGGSLFLGFIISWALIYSAEKTNDFNPSFALWCVAIPLFDLFTVIILRIVEKRSLMIANRDHIHHFLENIGFSKIKVLLLTVSSGFAILLLGKIIENNFPSLSFSVFILIFLFYFFIRIYNLPKKKLREINE